MTVVRWGGPAVFVFVLYYVCVSAWCASCRRISPTPTSTTPLTRTSWSSPLTCSAGWPRGSSTTSTGWSPTRTSSSCSTNACRFVFCSQCYIKKRERTEILETSGYPLHRENGQKKIPGRENTENLEILPKTQGIWFAQVVNSLFLRVKDKKIFAAKICFKKKRWIRLRSQFCVCDSHKSR